MKKAVFYYSEKQAEHLSKTRDSSISNTIDGVPYTEMEVLNKNEYIKPQNNWDDSKIVYLFEGITNNEHLSKIKVIYLSILTPKINIHISIKHKKIKK